MSDDSLTPEQQRQLRAAQRRMADPELQRRLRESQRSQAMSPRFRQISQNVAETVGPFVQTVLSALNSWTKSIDWDRVREVLRTVGEAIANLLPPNARALGTGYWPRLQQVAREEQLCLSWVPDADTARLLLDADSPVERERLLVDSAETVLSACERALHEAVEWFEAEAALADDSPETGAPGVAARASHGDDDVRRMVVEVADLLRLSIAAANAGHPEAAQALATCVTDTLIEQHINRRRGRTHAFLKFRLGQADQAQFIGLVIGPTLAAAESSFRQSGSWPGAPRGSRGDAVPYSRHATVHAAHRDAFTQATSLKAILLATSVLRLSMSPLLFVCLDLLDAGALRTQEHDDA